MRLIISLFIVIFVSSCKKDGSFQEKFLDATKKQTLYSISYGNHNRHKLDIALPKNRNEQTPTVIFIHGGAWIIGSKDVFAQEIQDFADAGFACATINYRYASSIQGIHHPALSEDIMLAVNYISSKAKEWEISADNFGLVGHSAGGHLATLTPYIMNNGKIKSCASWAGPLDFIDSEQLAISGANGVFETYVGRKLETEQDTALYKSASPYYVVQANAIPTLLIYATQDDGVPYSIGVKMENKLTELNIQTKLVTLSGAGHIWTGNDLSKAKNETLEWFLSTLSQ